MRHGRRPGDAGLPSAARQPDAVDPGGQLGKRVANFSRLGHQHQRAPGRSQPTVRSQRRDRAGRFVPGPRSSRSVADRRHRLNTSGCARSPRAAGMAGRARDVLDHLEIGRRRHLGFQEAWTTQSLGRSRMAGPCGRTRQCRFTEGGATACATLRPCQRRTSSSTVAPTIGTYRFLFGNQRDVFFTPPASYGRGFGRTRPHAGIHEGAGPRSV